MTLMYNMKRFQAAGCILMVLASSVALFATTPEAEHPTDPWLALHALLGVWQGEGSGFGTVSGVTHEWSFVLGGQFIQLLTRSVPGQEGGTGEVHEDIGFISHDKDRDSFVFRQFFSEGFVNTYDLDIHPGDTPVIEFAYREAESAGGMQARMRLRFLSADEYEMELDLAAPGKDFATCQSMRMKKAE
jgi:hypothetical protein